MNSKDFHHTLTLSLRHGSLVNLLYRTCRNMIIKELIYPKSPTFLCSIELKMRSCLLARYEPPPQPEATGNYSGDKSALKRRRRSLLLILHGWAQSFCDPFVCISTNCVCGEIKGKWKPTTSLCIFIQNGSVKRLIQHPTPHHRSLARYSVVSSSLPGGLKKEVFYLHSS